MWRHMLVILLSVKCPKNGWSDVQRQTQPPPPPPPPPPPLNSISFWGGWGYVIAWHTLTPPPPQNLTWGFEWQVQCIPKQDVEQDLQLTQRHWKKTKELAFLSLISVIYSWKWVQTKVNVYKTTRFIQKITRNWRNWQVKWWQFLPNFCKCFGLIYRPVGQLGPNLTWFSERYVFQVPVVFFFWSIFDKY